MEFELLKQFNNYANDNKSLIKKALDSSTGSGEALIPKHLEEVITNTMVRLSPELALLDLQFDKSKLHEFNQLTALPAGGGAMGEGAITPVGSSSYNRTSVRMKIVRRKGSVTNFLRDTSADYIDAATAEMENHLLVQAYDLNYYNIWGNGDSNGYEYSGIMHYITSNRVQNVVSGIVPSNLKFLDDMLDAVSSRGGSLHRRAFLLSPQMLSKVSQLIQNVRFVQSVESNFKEITINGGWRVNSYRGVALIETDTVRPKIQMGAVVATVTDGGGTIADGVYHFQVAPVTWDGEQIASSQVIATTGAIGNDASINLTWTAIEGAISYRIYQSTTSGAAKLVKQISAFTYNGSGEKTGNVVNFNFTSDPSVVGAELSTAEANDLPLVNTGGIPNEQVILWDLDKYQGLGKFAYTNSGGSKFDGLVTVEQKPSLEDDLSFMVKTYGALVPSFEKTSCVTRGLRVA